ncbi:DUF2786 domain-containing protein, partial [Vibrio parahaemolyticus]|uniref:DUF2786 domain-containing protein n=1 Tax=Vibrio parahaemolyticus TaxID=670 RepID=UPI001EEB02B5
LMSLAENAGNENEAANAFSKARIFMKKYHLELSDIYSAEPSPPPPSPRRKAPPRPLTPEERHREMTRLKQQEEQRLREFQKVAEQQQQRKRQREREQQALRELEKCRAQQSARSTPEPSPEPVPVRPPVRPAQSPRRPAAAQEERPQLIRRSPLLRPQNIVPAVVAAVLLLFVVYVLYLQ